MLLQVNEKEHMLQTHPDVADAAGGTHAHTLWSRIKQLHARKTRNNKLFMIKQMMLLRYRDSTPLAHLDTYMRIINQLVGMKITFDDEVQALWLLDALPDSWETFRTSFSNSAPDDTIIMDSLKADDTIIKDEKKDTGDFFTSGYLPCLE
ncbi:Retrovirus-related Pol polyprotein from transposon TNT 1-94-like protein [Drosera capensis]